jgi:hypothetical protein
MNIDNRSIASRLVSFVKWVVAWERRTPDISYSNRRLADDLLCTTSECLENPGAGEEVVLILLDVSDVAHEEYLVELMGR